MDDKKWMNDIRRKMDGFEMPPPEHLWEDIERQVNTGFAEHKTVGLHRRRTWMAAAVMAGALVMGGGVWLSTHQDGGSVSQSATPRPALANTPGTSGSSSSQTAETSLTQANGTHFAQIYQSKNGSHAVPTGMEGDSDAVSTGLEVIVDKGQKEPEIAPAPSGKETPQRNQPARQTDVYDSRSWDNTLLASNHSDGDRFSVSVTAAGLMGSNNQQGGYGELLAGSVWQDEAADGVKSDNGSSNDYGSLEEVIAGTNNREVYTKKKHRQPVKVGVSVNWRLSDRWTVGTGVTYSYLSSELTSGTDDSHYTTHQKLQYVGIPLNVSYTFYQHKRWSVYGTTGGMVEKCVKGKSSTDYIVGGKLESTQYDDVKEKRLQYSVGAAVGVQAKIADHVGFYVEPGVSCHFNNHSDVTNIYKDTPFNFSLGLGFRYSFSE